MNFFKKKTAPIASEPMDIDAVMKSMTESQIHVYGKANQK